MNAEENQNSMNLLNDQMYDLDKQIAEKDKEMAEVRAENDRIHKQHLVALYPNKDQPDIDELKI